MAKYTIELEDTAGFARRLRVQEEAHLGFPEAAAQFGEVAAQLEAQLPKPVPEEPTGDVLVDVDGELLRPRPPHWIPCVGYTNNPPTWAELVDGLEPGQIKIYDARPLATPPTEEVAEPDDDAIQRDEARAALKDTVPADKVWEVVAYFRTAADKWDTLPHVDRSAISAEMCRSAATKVEALLPKAGQ